MKTDKHINQAFIFLSSFLDSLVDNFNETGAYIKNGRNIVKVTKVDGVSIVIKSYHRLTIINRIIYALFRKSKAQRAYEHAEFLMDHDITTPIPIAYIDCYKHFMLRKSFFVSLYIKSKAVKQLFSPSCNGESKDIIQELAKFIFRLHQLGIFHGDLSLENILYSKVGDGYNFCLIDNNHMQFRRYTRLRAINNLKRIDLPIDILASLILEYSKMQHSDAYKTTQELLFFKERKKILSKLKRKVKKLLSPDKQAGHPYISGSSDNYH